MNEIRKKIVQFHTSGKGSSEIVRLMKVEKVIRMMVYWTLKRFKETCSVEDKLRSGRPTCVRTFRHQKCYSMSNFQKSETFYAKNGP